MYSSMYLILYYNTFESFVILGGLAKGIRVRLQTRGFRPKGLANEW